MEKIKEIKHFIYMDTDIVNSYISQLNNGLVISNSEEAITQTSKSKKEDMTDGGVKGNFEFGIPATVKIGTKIDDGTHTTSNTLMQTESGRELINKIIHDDSFNKFIYYLSEQNKIKKENDCSLGEYLLLKGNFKIWDLDYLIDVFNDELIEYTAMLSKDEEIKKFEEEKKKKPNASDERNIIKKLKEPLEYAMKMIKLCKRIMPYTKFITIDNKLIPINEKFLREEMRSIRFKYNEELIMIGRYTGDFFKNNNNNTCNAFSDVFDSLDEVIMAFLKDVLEMPYDTKIINPVALYVE